MDKTLAEQHPGDAEPRGVVANATFATLGGMRSPDEATQHLLREFFREVLEQAQHNEASWLEQLRGEIAAWIAYRVAYGQRFEIDHENDPPGDCSGELRRLPEGFDPENYETLGDFLEEPTGERTPTFERGCGGRISGGRSPRE